MSNLQGPQSSLAAQGAGCCVTVRNRAKGNTGKPAIASSVGICRLIVIVRMTLQSTEHQHFLTIARSRGPTRKGLCGHPCRASGIFDGDDRHCQHRPPFGWSFVRINLWHCMGTFDMIPYQGHTGTQSLCSLVGDVIIKPTKQIMQADLLFQGTSSRFQDLLVNSLWQSHRRIRSLW